MTAGFFFLPGTRGSHPAVSIFTHVSLGADYTTLVFFPTPTSHIQHQSQVLPVNERGRITWGSGCVSAAHWHRRRTPVGTIQREFQNSFFRDLRAEISGLPLVALKLQRNHCASHLYPTYLQNVKEVLVLVFKEQIKGK